MPLDFVYMFYFVSKLFFNPKISLTFTSIARLCPCHSKRSQMDKHLTQVKIFSLVVIFVNGMSMSDLHNKYQDYLGIEKKFKDKMEHTSKTQEHLCTLSLKILCIFV